MSSHIHSLAWHVQPLHITIHLHRHQISLWKICINCWVSKKPFWQNVSSETGHLLPVSQLESQVQPVCTSLDMIACQCLTYVPRDISLFCIRKLQLLQYKTIAHNQFCSAVHISAVVSAPDFASVSFCCSILLLYFIFYFNQYSSVYVFDCTYSCFEYYRSPAFSVSRSPFFLVRKRSLLPKVPIFVTKKMAFRVAKSKF